MKIIFNICFRVFIICICWFIIIVCTPMLFCKNAIFFFVKRIFFIRWLFLLIRLWRMLQCFFYICLRFMCTCILKIEKNFFFSSFLLNVVIYISQYVLSLMLSFFWMICSIRLNSKKQNSFFVIYLFLEYFKDKIFFFPV